MSDSLYRIVFRGEVLPGHAEAGVRAALGSRFRLPAEQIERLFSGRRMVLKKDLDAQAAARFESALQAIGADVQVEPMDAGQDDAASPAGAAAGAAAAAAPPLSLQRHDAPSTPQPGRTAPDLGFSAPQPPPTPPAGSATAGDGGETPELSFTNLGPAGDGGSQGASTDHDPYRPPSASVLVDPDEPGEVHPPVRRPFGRGSAWVGSSWRLFRASPGTWIGIYVVFMLLFLVSGLIPFVGGLAAYLLYPVFIAGIMVGADRLHRGGSMQIGDVFEGFKRNTGQLIAVGGVYLGGALGMALIGGIGVVAMGATMELAGNSDPDALALPVILMVLVVVALIIPLMMLIWFAPMLIVLNDVPVGRALTWSFKGCLVNFLPLLLYSLVYLVLFVLGMLPFLLGLLVVGPMFLASMYASYRDIYVD